MHKAYSNFFKLINIFCLIRKVSFYDKKKKFQTFKKYNLRNKL